MRKVFLIIGFILFTGMVFGQTRQAGEKLLQDSWGGADVSVEHLKPRIKLDVWLEFKGSKVNTLWFDAYGELPFIYENERLKIIFENGGILFDLPCFVAGNVMIILFDDGWIILRK